jgi:hypothetical protein
LSPIYAGGAGGIGVFNTISGSSVGYAGGGGGNGNGPSFSEGLVNPLYGASNATSSPVYSEPARFASGSGGGGSKNGNGGAGGSGVIILKWT